MHIPASDDSPPPLSLPGPSLTTLETLGFTISPMRKRYVPGTAEEFQASFDEIFGAYTKACKKRAGSLHDFRLKLTDLVLDFRFSKAAKPHIYPDVVKLPAIRSMLDLLNGKYKCGSLLAGFILCTFETLTDPDIFVPGQEEEATLFVESLVKLGALDVFVSTLTKFQSQLMDWVFKSLRSPKWNDLKMHVLGFLNTLLMSSFKNRLEFGKMDAVIVVVNALLSLEEDFVPHEEYLMETLFSCLLFQLECPDNIVKFAEAGGVQSMIGIINQEDFGYCHGSAIIALDIAVKACQSAYQEFVNDDLALDTAFHPFMDMNPTSIYHEIEEIEEHQISLIASLIGSIAKTKKDSVLKKFEENDFKRITWLMELYERYPKKVEATVNYLKGKQSVDVILGYLWSSENSTIRSRIKSQLTHHNLEMKHVEDSLSAYRDNIGNAGELESPKTAVEECIDSLERSVIGS
ncbi:hypothetical protein MKX03_022517 [Papaver bracteatum]|nr:hypothetical protein MKX03_022517 [Papaver bracteatum]